MKVYLIESQEDYYVPTIWGITDNEEIAKQVCETHNKAVNKWLFDRTKPKISNTADFDYREYEVNEFPDWFAEFMEITK